MAVAWIQPGEMVVRPQALLAARVAAARRQADSVGYKVQRDCESLRRTARFSRANREISVALELERIANEREAEMNSISGALGC